MDKITIEEKGDIAILRLTNGVTNAIGPEMIRELLEALSQIQEKFRGMVLAGGEKFFSMGWDLPYLLTLDRPGMAEFFYGFNDVCLALFTLPLPTVCAVRGHAVAGGHILATSCDFRLAAQGKTKFGLNEIHLGVPVPYLADMIQRQILSDPVATKMLVQGNLFSVDEAVAMALVDEVVTVGDVEEQAMAMVSELAALPAAAFACIKENRVESVQRRYERRFVKKNEAFLDCFFSPDIRGRLEEAAEKF